MSRPLRTTLPCLLLAALGAVGCVSLDPDYQQPELPVPAHWPIPPTTATTDSLGGGEEVGWRDFLVDERLERLVALALENNRDLRIAVLNVERSRAQHAIRRADLVPSVGAGVSGLRQRLPASQTGSGRAETFTQYTAEVGIASYELDLFGRVRSLSRSALEQFFAREEARRSAQLALIGEVATAYLTLAADRELQRLAEETVGSQEESFRLTQQRYELGAVSGLEVSQARTTVESARVDAARFAGNVAQDLSLLALLVGGPLDAGLLPDGFAAGATGLDPLPAGLPSEVLLRRPDVLAAEHLLRAAHADVGAARAAFFPRLTLTGSGGFASDELADLFDGASGFWSFLPQISLPIFQGGRLRANRQVAETDRALAVAEYERAIQVGFREISDALALTATLARQRAAQEALADAARRAYELSSARHDSGRDSYLVLLDSQRVWYGAQQGLIVTRLAEEANRVALYRVLGGGWVEGGGE